jgi:hypothetical protein
MRYLGLIKKTTMIKLLFFLLVAPLATMGQALTKKDSVWLPVKFFIGNWTGNSEGEPGKGKYERSYRFIFENQFIEVKNKSIYPPTDKNPKGEVHEDIGYISFDKIRKTFVLRQFHKEGFVNQYRLESTSPDGKSLVFISENIENIPAGWRARETYYITSTSDFTEVFELAAPGKEFELYSKAVLKKGK